MSALTTLLINLLMAACFVTMLAFRLTGGELHEWMGAGLCVLFVIHCLLNRNWFSTWSKGRYGFRRAVSSAVNAMLIVSMATIFITGLMNSRFVLEPLGFEGGIGVRQIHSFAAYWGMVLVGIHIGIHWRKVMVAICKLTRLNLNGIHWRRLRVAALIIACYGAWAFFDRDMGAKLFQGFAYDYWDSDRPALLFYLHNTAIIFLYAFVSHYTLKVIASTRHSTGGAELKSPM